MFIHNKKVLVVATLLLLVNVVLTLFSKTIKLPFLNIINTAAMFLFFLPYAKKKYAFLLGFSFLLLSSFCFWDYENSILRLGLHTFRSIANIFFIIHIYPKQKILLHNKFELYPIITIVVLLNLYVIYNINDLVNYYTGVIKYSSVGIFSLGISHILLATLTFLFHYTTDKIPKYFMLFVALYIVSDIFNILGYSFKFCWFYVLNRILYILSLYFLICHAHNLTKTTKNNCDVLSP
ncbi:hypothetical protein SAMN04487987_109105 [Algibacter pectinivorans]|uniref:YhhN-like protein n=1 Tax=Algibacter pectinivorans TaxID=870482 RepID=A0A1I1RBW6_9FLAO|nr:hypothetical protein SAMN04487987_109105 [Algibacter pectinivorans]